MDALESFVMCQWLDDTYELLDAAWPYHTRQELADHCGVHVEWLRKLKGRRIPNPGIVLVWRVHKALSGGEM